MLLLIDDDDGSVPSRKEERCCLSWSRYTAAGQVRQTRVECMHGTVCVLRVCGMGKEWGGNTPMPMQNSRSSLSRWRRVTCRRAFPCCYHSYVTRQDFCGEKRGSNVECAEEGLVLCFAWY